MDDVSSTHAQDVGRGVTALLPVVAQDLLHSKGRVLRGHLGAWGSPFLCL